MTPKHSKIDKISTVDATLFKDERIKFSKVHEQKCDCSEFLTRLTVKSTNGSLSKNSSNRHLLTLWFVSKEPRSWNFVQQSINCVPWRCNCNSSVPQAITRLFWHWWNVHFQMQTKADSIFHLQNKHNGNLFDFSGFLRDSRGESYL